jgi:hypothetical protein
MKILVKFTDSNQEYHEIIMEGPDIDTSELKHTVFQMLKMAMGDDLPQDFDFTIDELASGTIH